MKRFTKIAMVVGVLAVAGGSIAWGGHAARGAFANHLIGAHLDKALDYVDATPQQRAAVQEARKEIMAKVQAHRAQARNLPEELAAVLAADQLDVGKLNALIDQKAEMMKAFARELAPQIVKVHDAFTPQQRQKLLAKWTEMRAQRKQRWQQKQEQGGFGGQEE